MIPTTNLSVVPASESTSLRRLRRIHIRELRKLDGEGGR
jgi:hypothetical protein